MNPKISASHLKRRAIVYIRQSSPGQVIHNQESRKCCISVRIVAEWTKRTQGGFKQRRAMRRRPTPDRAGHRGRSRVPVPF
jgi:hypothetical protein